MIKLFFKLFCKDLFYYNNESDLWHKGMHNLSDLFFKEEPTKILDNITYYSFSIIFPKKKSIFIFVIINRNIKIGKNIYKLPLIIQIFCKNMKYPK